MRNIPEDELVGTKTAGSETEEQQGLGYKLEDIFRDRELALEIGNLLIKLALPGLVQSGKISRRQETDLTAVYDRTIMSMLTPEQREQAAEKDARREERNLDRIARGKRPKFTIHD